MVNRLALKNKYGNEKVFVIPYNRIEHIPDKFTYCKHDNSIWTKYDSIGTYVNRWEAEYEPSLQQIIPYFFITNEDNSKIFVAKRIKGDHRLVDSLSLGFGGHIDECDGYSSCVLKCLTREMFEELDIEPLTKATYLGTMRDITSPTNDHFGLVFSLKADEDKVFIKEKDKMIGQWMTKQELYDNYHKFENWAKYIIDYLFENNKI